VCEAQKAWNILLMQNDDFAGRVAIVTGAWRGLGRAVAARLHERGASVAVNVRDRERAQALAKEIGERAHAVPGDVASEGVPDEIARLTLERFGRIDILVNNAALPLSTRFPDLTAEEWRKPFFRQCAPSTTAASLTSPPRPAGW